MVSDPFLGIWLIVWPLLAIFTFGGYIVSSKKQDKDISAKHIAFFALGILIWAVTLAIAEATGQALL